MTIGTKASAGMGFWFPGDGSSEKKKAEERSGELNRRTDSDFGRRICDYEDLIPLAERKTQVIVANDLQALQSITEQEQSAVDRIGALERKRQEVIVNIGIVLNRNPSTLDFRTLIAILEGQEAEQDALRRLHDRLRQTVGRLSDINKRNKALIQQSLEMIEFNMNFIQSTWMSPGMSQAGSQYGKSASEVQMSASQTGMFDAKQ